MDIKSKITKLLALSTSPNENEAKAALLKARQLMAEHKLQVSDVAPSENARLVQQLCSITCTKQKDPWKIDLSAVIADAYCCTAYNNHVYRSKTYRIGFIGLEDDFEICKKIYLYAVDCVESEIRQIQKVAAEKYVPKYIDRLANAYGTGFCLGVKESLKKQTENHEEYALVLAKPKQVQDATEKLESMKRQFNNLDLSDIELLQQAARGQEDGEDFNPAARITA